MARAGTTSHLRDSPPPSPISPTPSVSDSDDLTDNVGPSASRPGSPTLLLKLHPNTLEPDDSVTCQWEDCGVVFTHLPTLIDHIHNDHIGVHKPSYTCEWASCQRRGLPQISRYALLSHIRSHTGEKPFTCPRPECDKSFTRSDALAKHMRLQHNTSPPAPGRGGSRKRKRGNDDQPTGSAHLTNTTFSGVPSSTDSTGAGGFSTFKVEPNTPSESFDDIKPPDYFARPQNGRRRSSTPRASSVVDDDEGYTSSSDVLPAHLLPHYVPSTGLVLGRSPAMVMYLLMKAKYKYALDQHESLCEELRVARSELKREKEAKEGALNLVLRGVFGAQAEHLITPIPQPPGISEPESYDPGPNSLSNMNGHTQ